MGALEDLISAFGKGSYNKQTRDCIALGCPQRVFGHALFCPECWRQIPSDLQQMIEKYHRPGRRPSKVCAGWIQQAIDECSYIRSNGRRPPTPQSFMWDDAPPAPAPLEPSLFEEPK